MKRRKLRQVTIPLLPSLLTLCNGVCGLGSITLATSSQGDTDRLFWAAALIFLGMLFDMLDGQMARLTRQTSRFGAELDSLCDTVTFGLAPVFIMLAFVNSDNLPSWFEWPMRIVWPIGALFAVSAILRLARYNVEADKHENSGYFKGLPSPAAAGMIASFAIAMPSVEELTAASMPEANQLLGVRLIMAAKLMLPVLSLVVAGLMVSRIRYPHLANQFLAGRRSFYHLVELVFALAAILMLKEVAAPLFFCYFAFAPVVNQARIGAWTRLNGPLEEKTAATAPVERGHTQRRQS